MNKQFLVTVGITNYNNARYLTDCLDSVFNQTYKNLEVIVVDDCSTDQSPAILEKYSNRIKLIEHSQNSGSLVRGRIEVINVASGDFIAHLDADDFWEPTFVEVLVSEFIKNPELDWVVGNTNLVNSGGFVINRWDYSGYSTSYEDCIRRAFRTASLPFPNNGLFKTSFIRNNDLSWYRFPDTLQGEDALTSTKYLECRPQLKHIDRYLFNYRIHGSNMSANPAERIKMILNLKDYYFKTFEPKLLFDDPRLIVEDTNSSDTRALSHLLLSQDLLEIKRNLKIPAAFSNDNTESETLDNLWRFDNPIKEQIRLSLSLSQKYSKESQNLLNTLEQTQSITEGRKKLLLGDFQNAETDFRKVVENSSDSPEALCALGETYFLKGDRKKSEEFTVKAFQIAPQNSKILNNAGVIFNANQDYENAVRSFISAIITDPHNVDAHLNLTVATALFSRDRMISSELNEKLASSLKWLSNNYPDRSREQLLVENWTLVRDTLNRNRNIYGHTHMRILIHRPNNGALKYLMQSWSDVLNHVGVETELLEWGESVRTKLESFEPDLFITVNDPIYLNTLDMNTVSKWREEKGLKLALILSYDKLADDADILITFHRNPQRSKELSKSHLPLISVPFAINPLNHFVRPGRELWDYFFVGTNSSFKKRETAQHLSPIIENYNGILAGVGWNRGVPELSVEDIPLFYSFARICPNYHVTRQIEEYNEVNERTFIIAACGGFQIVDNPRAMNECFTSEEMPIARSPREYREMFAYYLEHEEERLPFIRKGMNRVFQEHTLFQVLSRLIESVGTKSNESSKVAVTN